MSTINALAILAYGLFLYGLGRVHGYGSGKRKRQIAWLEWLTRVEQGETDVPRP